MKYILVSGGVLSGLGKGVIASSVGRLLKEMGYSVTAIKIDPYINIDAGTMSPFEHGEVFVLDDGGEADLDLGNYERFMDISLTKDNNITTGKIYDQVIKKERQGKYLGKTVQVVPHITSAIQDWIERVAESAQPAAEICVIELGGTVGDIESMPFVEAMRQFQFRVGQRNFCEMHVSLVPLMHGEQKSKPTQQAVRELRALGLNPDFVFCRCEVPVSSSTRQKVSLFCHVDPAHVISVHNVPSVMSVPLLLAQQNVHKLIMERLDLTPKEGQVDLSAPGADPVANWRALAQKFESIMEAQDFVRIALVGKYTELQDAYFSVTRALQHAQLAEGMRVEIDWIESESLEDSNRDENLEEYTANWAKIRQAHGVLVPGGFGDRGIEGKIAVAKYARENNIPYLGICLGFQIAVIEIARNVLKIEGATSEEFGCTDPEKQAVVFMPEISKTHMGGTMRLGARETLVVDQQCQLAKLYENKDSIMERHRHRYEINPRLVERIEKESNMRFVGHSPDHQRMIMSELKDHPYFVGVQFHPEFLSRPMRPSPPFVGLVRASIAHKQQINGTTQQ